MPSGTRICSSCHKRRSKLIAPKRSSSADGFCLDFGLAARVRPNSRSGPSRWRWASPFATANVGPERTELELDRVERLRANVHVALPASDGEPLIALAPQHLERAL